MKTFVAILRGTAASLTLGLNTTLAALPIFFISLLKLLVPNRSWRLLCSQLLNRIAEFWINCNELWLPSPQDISWKNIDPDRLSSQQSYLVTSNHQTWADIFLVQYLLNGRTPQMKFFLKQELIWVPVIGLCWWALDFPFMKRYRKSYLKKHPGKKGKDQQTTIKACQKFRNIPIAIYNFMEGTRFTPEKHKRQQSPYRHLLKPKAGGVGIVLSALGDEINLMIDITIHYRETTPGFWDLLCGRNGDVTMVVEQKEIPAKLLNRDYSADSRYRTELLTWINSIWKEKDQLLDELQRKPGKKAANDKKVTPEGKGKAPAPDSGDNNETPTTRGGK